MFNCVRILVVWFADLIIICGLFMVCVWDAYGGFELLMVVFDLWLLLGFCGLFDFGLRWISVAVLLLHGCLWLAWSWCCSFVCVVCGLWFALWLSLIAYAFAFGLVVFACIVYLWC